MVALVTTTTKYDINNYSEGNIDAGKDNVAIVAGVCALAVQVGTQNGFRGTGNL